VINASLKEPNPQAGPFQVGITALSFSTVVTQAAPVVASAR